MKIWLAYDVDGQASIYTITGQAPHIETILHNNHLSVIFTVAHFYPR
jgi:hypothetical protein